MREFRCLLVVTEFNSWALIEEKTENWEPIVWSPEEMVFTIYGWSPGPQLADWFRESDHGRIAMKLLNVDSTTLMNELVPAPTIYDAEATRRIVHVLSTPVPGLRYSRINAIKEIRNYVPGSGLIDVRDRVFAVERALIDVGLLVPIDQP